MNISLDDLPLGKTTLIWNKVESKFKWSKLSTVTEVVPTKIGYIIKGDDRVTLYDNNDNSIGVLMNAGLSWFMIFDQKTLDKTMKFLLQKYNDTFVNFLLLLLWKCDSIE